MKRWPVLLALLVVDGLGFVVEEDDYNASTNTTTVANFAYDVVSLGAPSAGRRDAAAAETGACRSTHQSARRPGPLRIRLSTA
jgi:hypothetical protein